MFSSLKRRRSYLCTGIVVSVLVAVAFSGAATASATEVAWGADRLDVPASGTLREWGHPPMRIPEELKTEQVTAVAAGSDGEAFALALTPAGKVVAWGDPEHAAIPNQVKEKTITAIAASDFSLALSDDGNVYAWGGDNDKHQLDVPQNIQGRVKQITAGDQYGMALTVDGTVHAWGLNNEGQVNVPTGLGGVQAIAAGEGLSIALASDGLHTWGNDYRFKENAEYYLKGDKILGIATGENRTVMILTSSHGLVIWGCTRERYCQVPGELTNVVAMSGSGVPLALDKAGKIWAFGAGEAATVPAEVAEKKAIAISGSFRYSLAIVQDNSTRTELTMAVHPPSSRLPADLKAKVTGLDQRKKGTVSFTRQLEGESDQESIPECQNVQLDDQDTAQCRPFLQRNLERTISVRAVYNGSADSLGSVSEPADIPPCGPFGCG